MDVMGTIFEVLPTLGRLVGYVPKPASEELAAKKAAAPEEIEVEPDLLRETLSVGGEFSPADLNRARRKARAGNPHDGLYPLYEEMPRFGLAKQVGKSLDAISGAKITIEADEEYSDEDNKSPDAVMARRVAAEAREVFKDVLPDAFGKAASAIGVGISSLRLLVSPGEGPNGTEAVKSLKEIPARRYRKDRATNGWLLMPKVGRLEGIPIEPLMEKGSLLFFEIEDSTPIDQRGLYFKSLLPWAIMTFGFRWWGKRGELTGTPFRQITYDPSVKGAKAQAEQILKNAGFGAAAAFPTGVDFKFVAALLSAGNDLERIVEFCDRYLDGIWCGHSQASGVQEGTGSKNSADKADQNFIRLTNSRLRWLCGELLRQLIRPWVVRNYGPEVAKKFTPCLTATAVEPVDVEVESRVAKNLSDGGAQNLPEADVLKRCGYRMAKPGEATMKKSAAPVQDAAAAPPQGLRARFGAAPPDISAPRGVAEELVAPYREILARAIAEGLEPGQALIRVLHRMREAHDAPGLTDTLTALLLDQTLSGWVEEGGGQAAREKAA